MSDKVSSRVDWQLNFVELILSRRGEKKTIASGAAEKFSRISRYHDVLNIQRISTR